MYKKVFVSMLLAIGFIIAFSSCNKCKECTYWGISEEVCSEDYDSKEDWEDAIDIAEDFGATCS